MMMHSQENLLGQILVAMGKLDPNDLEMALREHRKSGDRIGSILMKMGFSSEDDVLRALSQQLAIPFVRLSEIN